MSKALIVGAVVVTLVQVVIASNSPILDASMVGGAVLFLVALWDEFARETSPAGAERSSPQEGGSVREGEAQA
jgi:hypothetical protein